MPDLRASVVIVSHGRPAHLRRAVLGVLQLYHRPLELVVVADVAGLDAIRDVVPPDRVKTAQQTRPNIAEARNVGIGLAAGEVIAFLDDDAVPEPTWLSRLMRAFETPTIQAATGQVLGRSGFLPQWGCATVTALAEERRLTPPGAGLFVPNLSTGMALKLNGTNMAVRRQVLLDQGGFDPVFRFYLDDTDLAFRLRQAGAQVAYVPDAMVHHGFAPSTRRRTDRVPTTLRDIGRSTALYLRKHAAEADRPRELEALRQSQVKRLNRFVLARGLQPMEIAPLLADLDAGIADGLATEPPPMPEIGKAPPTFLPLSDMAAAADPVFLSGRWFQGASRHAAAVAAVAEGRVATVFLFTPTHRAHRQRFVEPGYWLQTGGLFGRSDRAAPRFQVWSFRKRVAAEIARARMQRSAN